MKNHDLKYRTAPSDRQGYEKSAQMVVLITLFFSVYGLLFGIAISIEKYVLDMTSFCGTLIVTCR